MIRNADPPARLVRTMVAAGALAAAFAAPAFMWSADDTVAIIPLPGAPRGEAVRAGLDAGGALIDVGASGSIAIMAPPEIGAFQPRGRVLVLRSPTSGLCTDKVAAKRSENGVLASAFTTS